MEKKGGAYDLISLFGTVHCSFWWMIFFLSVLGFRILCSFRYFSLHVYILIMAREPFQQFGSICWFLQRTGSIEFLKSSSIYTNRFFVICLFILKLIVFHMKTLHIVLGIGFHLINKKGNLWTWEYIFTMTSGLCNRNHCFNKGIGIL